VMDTNVAEVTVRVVDAVNDPTTPVITVVPGCLEKATFPLRVATAVLEEDQVALVKVCVLPSL